MYKKVIIILIMFNMISSSKDDFLACKFLTTNKQELLFNVQFHFAHMLISKDQFVCNEANKCKLELDEGNNFYAWEYYSYQEIEVELQTKNGKPILVNARLTDLSFNVLGLLPTADWKSLIKNVNLKIDLVTGQTDIIETRPVDLLRLEIHPNNGQLFLKAKIENKANVRFETGLSHSNIELMFPDEQKKIGSNNFLMMNYSNMIGWISFINNLNFNLQSKFEGSFIFSDTKKLSYDSNIFYNYDGEPFKFSYKLEQKDNFSYLGLFFVMKSKMQLFLIFKAVDGNIQAYIDVEDGPYNKFWYFRLVTILYWIGLIMLGIAFFWVILLFCPEKLRLQVSSFFVDKSKLDNFLKK